MVNSYDVGIIGVGVAGAFASYKLAKDHKDLKCVAFDIGRKWAKRRRQLEGFLGCLPNSDGKFYLNDLNELSLLLSKESIDKSNNEVMSILSNIKTIDIIKSKSPKKSIINKFKKIGYTTTINDYFQLIPQDIHSLSRYMAATLEDSNIDFNFEEEILNIRKQNSMFIISPCLFVKATNLMKSLVFPSVFILSTGMLLYLLPASMLF
jgi:protoporphyrinogen oxidase